MKKNILIVVGVVVAIIAATVVRQLVYNGTVDAYTKPSPEQQTRELMRRNGLGQQ